MAGAGCRYRIYGLTLRVNRQLPHLRHAIAGDPGDTVHVRFGEGVPALPAARVRYGGARAIEFAVDEVGTRVWADWSGVEGEPEIASATALLAGPVLGGLLRLRRTTSLHGCAIAVGDGAIVLLGDQGTGKSTLAAALAQRGHAVLADDVAALAEHPGGWSVHPGYPRLRLTPATIAALREHGSLPRDAGPVLPRVDKRYAALTSDGDAWRFAPDPLRLRAIYVLTRDLALVAPRVSPLQGAERLGQLVRHVRASPWPLPASVRAGELARLARLAAAVPIRRLACPEGLGALAGTRRLLAEGLDVAA